jgi:hypothetical protein
MPKVLIEIKNGALTNVETTSDDVEIYVFDHDVISEGSTGELKRYLAQAIEPVDVDGIVSEDELMAKLEDLIAEGQAKLGDMAGVWDGAEELDEVGEA